MVLERQRAAELGYPSPIQDTKEATHANYNRCGGELGWAGVGWVRWAGLGWAGLG